VRVTRKWVDDVGTPLYPHNHEPMELDGQKGGDDANDD
jgi:hypothetical protein